MLFLSEYKLKLLYLFKTYINISLSGVFFYVSDKETQILSTWLIDLYSCIN